MDKTGHCEIGRILSQMDDFADFGISVEIHCQTIGILGCFHAVSKFWLKSMKMAKIGQNWPKAQKCPQISEFFKVAEGHTGGVLGPNTLFRDLNGFLGFSEIFVQK